MRSILSADAYQQIADNCSRQGKPLAPLGSISSQQCMSVTGQPLSFSGTMVIPGVSLVGWNGVPFSVGIGQGFKRL